MEVEEGDILSFHFNNFSLRNLYVYVFCFEETGGYCQLACAYIMISTLFCMCR